MLLLCGDLMTEDYRLTAYKKRKHYIEGCMMDSPSSITEYTYTLINDAHPTEMPFDFKFIFTESGQKDTAHSYY